MVKANAKSTNANIILDVRDHQKRQDNKTGTDSWNAGCIHAVT